MPNDRSSSFPFNLTPATIFKLNSMPRGANLTVPILNSCDFPYKKIFVNANSECCICSCDGHLPIPVGKVQDFNSIEEVFASPVAKIIQKDVDDKNYTWCAVEHCGIQNHPNMYSKYCISIGIDDSCNIYCPSCRRGPIMHQAGLTFEQKKADVLKIMSWLEKFQFPVEIILGLTGDPLSSSIIRPIFQNFVPGPKQTITLTTNGLLLKKQLDTSSIPTTRIKEFFISVDAGSKEVYENVRLGGRWEVLLENFEFLKERNLSYKVTLKFCVQQSNWKDVPNFVKLCQLYRFSGVIHQLDNFGTWITKPVNTPDEWTIVNGTFSDHNVTDAEHPDYTSCRETITQLLPLPRNIKLSHELARRLDISTE